MISFHYIYFFIVAIFTFDVTLHYLIFGVVTRRCRSTKLYTYWSLILFMFFIVCGVLSQEGKNTSKA